MQNDSTDERSKKAAVGPQFASEKERLECAKLPAEIDHIKAPLWRIPAFYSALGPVLLAMLGLILTWRSGWFDAQKLSLEAKRETLEFEVAQLNDRKQAQEAVVAQLRQRIEDLTRELAGITA